MLHQGRWAPVYFCQFRVVRAGIPIIHEMFENLLFPREQLSAPDTFIVVGHSGEVDLAVLASCNASIIGESCLMYLCWQYITDTYMMIFCGFLCHPLLQYYFRLWHIQYVGSHTGWGRDCCQHQDLQVQID